MGCLIVNEYAFPFLGGLLIALEYYHLIFLYKTIISRISMCACVRDEGE